MYRPLIFMLSFMWMLHCSGQCPDGNVLFIQQEEVDQFLLDYPECDSILGNLTIVEEVYNLSALQNIKYVEGHLTISNTSELKNLIGLESLERVEKILDIKENLLTSLKGLENLNYVGGRITLFRNELIEDIDGLKGLDSVGGGIRIVYANNLEDLHGIDGISCIGGELYLTVLPNVIELPDFKNLGSLGDLYVVVNNSLVDLSGLEGIDTIMGYINISQNAKLESLKGLENLVYVGGYVGIAANPKLSSLEYLKSLRNIESYLVIFDNDALYDMTGLEELTRLGGGLRIGLNDNVDNLSGLHSITRLEGGLTIDENDRLRSLKTLSNVTYIGERINITLNPKLLNLEGLENFDPIDIKELYITDNAQLSRCDIDPICTALENIPDIFKDIRGNFKDCKDEMALREACNMLTSNNPFADDGKINLYPNPVGDVLNIVLELDDNVEFRVYNLQGQLEDNFIVSSSTRIIQKDVRHWEPGLKFIELYFKGEVISRLRLLVY